MNSLATLVKKELLEQQRTKKILILIVVFLFVAIGSPIFAQMTPTLLKSMSIPGLNINLPDPTYNDSIDQFIKNISQIALLVLIFIVAGAIVDEKNKKTLDIMLSKPISRNTFVISKFLAYIFSVSTIFILSAIIFYLYTVSIFGNFSFSNFALMALVICLYLDMIISITILASTYVKNIIAAAGIGFIGFILLGSVASLFDGLKKIAPGYIFSNYKDIIATGWTNELILPIIMTITFIAASIITALLLFKRQEIER